MIHNLDLIALFEETQRLKERIESVSIKHIYMEKNIMVDEMSKDGINMVEGSSHITQMQKFDQIDYSHNPFYFILECSFFL